MRKLLTPVLIAICFASSAQITILRTDYGKIGDKSFFAVDTPTSASLSSIVLTNGSNRTWNFSAIVLPHILDSFTYTTPASGAPATANLWVQANTGSHLENVDSVGARVILDRPNNNMNGLTLKIIKFPLTYNSVSIDSINYTKLGTPADFNAPFLSTIGYDSVKAEIKAYDTSTCLGWGLLQLPDTSCNTLKVKLVTAIFTSLTAHSAFSGWVSINSLANVIPHQRIVEYQWFAKNAKGYVARASMDSNNVNVQSFTYRLRKVNVPAIALVSPSKSLVNNTLNIQVLGKFTHFTFGSGLTATLKSGASQLFSNSVVAVNDTLLTINATVSTMQKTGLYNLEVNDPVYGLIKLDNAFMVFAAPKLYNISPASKPRGAVASLTISGSNTHWNTDSANLTIGFYYKSVLSANLNVLSLNIINDTVVLCTVFIDSSATKGLYAVKTNNLTDGTLELKDSFEVNAATGLTPVYFETPDWKFYPNPAKDYLELEGSFTNSNNTLLLFDITGKLVQTEVVVQPKTLVKTDKLEAGCYYIILQSEGGRFTGKLMINR